MSFCRVASRRLGSAPLASVHKLLSMSLSTPRKAEMSPSIRTVLYSALHYSSSGRGLGAGTARLRAIAFGKLAAGAERGSGSPAPGVRWKQLPLESNEACVKSEATGEGL